MVRLALIGVVFVATGLLAGMTVANASVAPGELAVALCQPQDVRDHQVLRVSDDGSLAPFRNKGECVAYVVRGGLIGYQDAQIAEDIFEYLLIESEHVAGWLIVNNTACDLDDVTITGSSGEVLLHLVALPGETVFGALPPDSIVLDVFHGNGRFEWVTTSTWGAGSSSYTVCAG